MEKIWALDWESLLQKVDRLFITSTYGDLKEIKETYVDVKNRFDEYTRLTREQETWYENKRLEKSLELKRKKAKGEEKMSDKHIDEEAKQAALNEFWNYKETKEKKDHYERALFDLKDLMKQVIYSHKVDNEMDI